MTRGALMATARATAAMALVGGTTFACAPPAAPSAPPAPAVDAAIVAPAPAVADPLLVYAGPRAAILRARETGEGTAPIPIALDHALWRLIASVEVAEGAAGVSGLWSVAGQETTIVVELRNRAGADLEGALGRLDWTGADGPAAAWFEAPTVPAGGTALLAVVLDTEPDIASLDAALSDPNGPDAAPPPR